MSAKKVRSQRSRPTEKGAHSGASTTSRGSAGICRISRSENRREFTLVATRTTGAALGEPEKARTSAKEENMR
jgi:hypothetical protein